jgi:hypothetical protein
MRHERRTAEAGAVAGAREAAVSDRKPPPDRLSDDDRRAILDLIDAGHVSSRLLAAIRDELARKRLPEREEAEDAMRAWAVKRDVAKLAAELGRQGVSDPITRAREKLARKYGHASGLALKRACAPSRVRRRSRGKGGQK